MASSVSTLSTGLNKSDEFIKEHAVRIHSRALTFKNGQILYLNEDSAIPAVSNNDHARYLRCQSITYFQDYDTYHSNITLQIVTTDGTQYDLVVNKTNLNQMGLIQALNDSMSTDTPGLRLVPENSSAQDYNGIRIFADANIQTFKINHEGAWLLGVLSTFTPSQQRTLYTLFDFFLDTVNNVQFDTRTRSSRTFYPLHNGGIHKLIVSEDDLATSQYINGHKTATIAEMNIAPTLNSRRGQKKHWNCDESVHYVLLPHPLEPNGSTIADAHDPSPDDPEMKVVLPSCISYLVCNEQIFRDILTPVVITKDTPLDVRANVIRSVTNVTDADKVGEIQLSLNDLSRYSYKWLLRVHVNTPTILSRIRDGGVDYVGCGIMFTFRNAAGNTIEWSDGSPWSYIQSRLFLHQWTEHIQNQCHDAEFSLSFDISHASLLRAKYICIRHFLHNSSDFTDKAAVNATLRLFSLDENDTQKDFIKRKFPTRSSVINPTITPRGDQPMTNSIHRLTTYPSTLLFLSPRSKTFDESESPWLECTTNRRISSLRLHVQDEYGQDIKTTSVANAPFYLNVAFADVPNNVNANN